MLSLVRKIAIVLVLISPACFAQNPQALLDMHGQTSGTSTTAANLTSSTQCLPAGDTWGTPVGSPIYTSTNAQSYLGALTINGCGGSPFAGNSGLALRLANTSTDKVFLNLGSGSGYTSVSTSFIWVSDASGLGSSDRCDQFALESGVSTTDTYVQVFNDPTNGTVLVFEGGSTGNGEIQVTLGQPYTITMQNNGGVASAAPSFMQVQDSLGNVLPNIGSGTVAGFPGLIKTSTTVGQSNAIIAVFGSSSIGTCSASFAGSHEFISNFAWNDTGAFPLYSPTPYLSNQILLPPNVMDWTLAGIAGGIPSSAYTQCGTTLAPGTYAGSTIAATINACPSNTYYLLAAGNFTLSSPLSTTSLPNSFELRGSGASTTKVTCGPGVAGSNCINLSGSSSTTSAVAWTAGYEKGTTSITVASVPGGVVANQSFVILTQCETLFTGSTCSTGTSTDNGGPFNCSVQYNSTGPTGCSTDGPDGTQTFRWQEERHLITNISGTTLTLQDPLIFPNWAAGQTPQATFVTAPAKNIGIASMQIDESGLGSSSSIGAVSIQFCVGCWAQNMAITNSQTDALVMFNDVHFIAPSNYMAFSQTLDNHGFAAANNSYGLFQNNIVQGFQPAVSCESGCTGNVIAYNYIVNMFDNTDLMAEGIIEHSNGDSYNLFEGNVTNQFHPDIDHGTHMAETTFRNVFTGWESCGTPGQCGGLTKDSSTIALAQDAFDRYGNNLANVMGTPGYTTTYKSASAANKLALAIGQNRSGSVSVPSDPLVATTGIQWGNWDNVTAGCTTVAPCSTATPRFCGATGNTGFATTCSSTSEVGTSGPFYPQLIPQIGDTVAGEAVMPASLYLTTKPAFFGSIPWPAIGPDVTGGNVGQCSGTLNTSGQMAGVPAIASGQCPGTSLLTSWGGHFNAIPAMVCALTVMGMPADGSGTALAFNPSACFGAAPVQPITIAPKAFVQIRGGSQIRPGSLLR